MAFRQHSTSILDIGARGSSTDIALDPTSLREWFNGPSQISIGGNARVHLGDQHNSGTISTSDRDRDTDRFAKRKDYRNLGAVSTAMQFIDFSASILSTRNSVSPGSYGSLHIRLACGTLQSLRTRLLAYVEQLEKSPGLGNDMLTEALNGCINVAEGLATALDGMLNAAIGFSYSSLQQIVASACTEEHMIDMLTFLRGLREKALVALLILLRPEPILTTSNSVGTAESTERILLNSIRELRKEHALAVDGLYRATTVWFGLSWSDTKLAAEKWRATHTSLIVDYAEVITQEMGANRNRALRLQILSSLAYTEMERRYHTITQAQSRTFNWLFDDSDNSPCSRYNFARWLRSSDPAGCRVYWIRGKPGSGKSTLMRHLHDDPRTRNLAEIWAGKRKLLVASCFFWGSGTMLQKSQEGLLQTLLRQLLVACSEFTQDLFGSRWNLLELGSDFDQRWSADELRDAIFKFVVLYAEIFSLLVLVDGLDEYQGSDSQRQSVCSLLKELSKYTNVKVCASSRPWNVYRDAFKDCPKLRLEQLTKQDITNFIEDKFESNEHYYSWSQLDPKNAQCLVAAMVAKAAGVFLWVRLVVESVLIGLRNGDDAYDLARRLRDIPADLEDLFRQLLSRLEPFYLESASKTFELALRQNGHGHLVMVYNLIHEHGNNMDITVPTRMLSASEVLQKQEVQERRINAQCMGLLEFIPVDEGRMRPFHTVEFLHRTARDFMASEEMRRNLLSWRRSPWNVETALLEAHTRLLQTCDPDAPWMHISAQFGHLTAILRRLAEVAQPYSIFNTLAAGEHHFNSLIHAARKFSLWIEHGNFNSFFGLLDRDQTDFLGLAIQEGAISYVLSRLPFMNPSELRRREGRPLLDFALTSRSAKRSAPSLALVAGLLTLGASPNDVWDRTTVWARFLRHLRECRISHDKVDTYVEVIRLLLSAGASDEIYDDEGRRIEVPCQNLAIRAALPKKDAEDLISSSGGALGYFRAQTNKVKSWLSYT